MKMLLPILRTLYVKTKKIKCITVENVLKCDTFSTFRHIVGR